MGIREELIKATNVTPGSKDDEQTWRAKLLRAVSNLDDKAWDDLSEPAQDWFDSAAEAFENKKAIPDFPDEAKVSRRRTVEDAEKSQVSNEKEPAAESKDEYQLSVGDVVKLTTKRGAMYEGEVMEFDDTSVIVKVGTEEEKVRRSNVVQIELVMTRSERLKKAKEKPAKVEEKPAKVEEKPAKAEEKQVTKRSVPVTQSIREMICNNIAASKEEIDGLCQKAGFEYRKSTLDIMFADTQATIRCLRELGKL